MALAMGPRTLPPWTEKYNLRLRERAAKAYRTKSAVLRKIGDWRPRLGERADRVSIPASAAFRAITRSHRRPAARADTPRTPSRKKPAIKNEASFVKRRRGADCVARMNAMS